MKTLMKMEPQINTDERRFVGSLSAFIGVHLRFINSYTLNKNQDTLKP